ncbi:cytochrome P450 [Paenibacillus sp. P26]|nr:cytochrome P450 [Paenibacillus sp. P26]
MRESTYVSQREGTSIHSEKTPMNRTWEKSTPEALRRELSDLEIRLGELRSELLSLPKHDRHRRAVIRAERQFVNQRIEQLRSRIQADPIII